MRCADLKDFKGREKTSITIMCHSKTITKTEGNDDATAEQLAVIRSSHVLQQQQQQQKPGAIAAVSDGTPSAAVVEEETTAAAAAAASSGSFSWALRKTAAVVGTGTSTAHLHEEQDQQSRQPGRRVLGQALKKVQRKQSHGRIRKLPSQQQKQPSIQNFKAPVIIHTYSPKTIHTEPEHFMSLVQKLTGSSHTRLRLADKKELCGSYTSSSSMSSCLGSCTENKIDACLLQQQDVVSELLLQPELCNSSFVSESSAQYCSPSSPAASSSSEEEDQYSRFPCNSGLVAKMNMQTLLQCDDELSPKGPLPSYGGGHELLQEYVDAGGSYEFLNPSIFFSVSSAFDQLQAATNPSSVAAAKREPLSPGTLSSFSDGLTFSFPGADMVTVDAAPSASTSCNNIGTSTTKFGLPQRCHELHHQDDHMMSLNSGAAALGGCSGTDQSSCIDAAAGLSYTNFASTVPAGTFNDLMADILPPTAQFSPARSWSSSFFQLPECFNSSSPSDSSPALPFSHIAYSPTPGNMLSLRDIEAAMYIDELLRG